MCDVSTDGQRQDGPGISFSIKSPNYTISFLMIKGEKMDKETNENSFFNEKLTFEDEKIKSLQH